MNIYIMRHGTTVWNEKGITQGRTNNRLSSNGKQLTETIAKKYQSTKFDIIFTSPLMRTMQTSNIMNKYHKTKIIKDERLIEIEQGIFTGRSKFDLTDKEIKLKNARDKSCKMESYESVYKRTQDFINDLKTNYEVENVLIITHNVNSSFIEDIFLNINVDFSNNEHLRRFKNAEIKKFII